MSDILRKVPFTEELLPEVQDFHCGDEPWETPLAAWIKAGPDIKNGALYEMKKVTQKGKCLDVWLHVNEAGDLVGYSSLGESNWRWPLATDPRVPVNVIPNLAIEKPFQGKPSEPPRYSKQILDHLVFEARRYTTRYPLLGLDVDPRNIAALKVYRREGFQDFQIYTDKNEGITYQGMILKLAEYHPFVDVDAVGPAEDSLESAGGGR